MVGLYLHLPFCRVRCPFCDFIMVTRQRHQVSRYLTALEQEISRFAGVKVLTIYLGGGTPSTIPGDQWVGFFNRLRTVVSVTPDAEVSLEANPEDVQQTSLLAWQAAGINRLSLGVQSFQDRFLQRLSRAYTGNAAKQAVTWAREAGFTNVNLDLMYGLPGQTLEDWRWDVETALALSPDHLSLYALTIEAGTAFASHAVSIDEDVQAEMYAWSMERLPAAGYLQYELSNFAKPGYESRHNLGYWRCEPYLGVGVGAWSFLGGVRYRNVATFTEYLEVVETRGMAWNEEDRLPQERRAREALILALRLTQGVPRSRLDQEALATLSRFERCGLIEQIRGNVGEGGSSDTYRLTPQGRRLSNQVFCELV